MIARFRVMLPFKLSIPEGLDLNSYEIERNGYKIVVHPPIQAQLRIEPENVDLSVPAREVTRKIVPATPQRPTALIKLNGSDTIQANLLELDFKKCGGHDFDREARDDPPYEIALEIVNSLLRRLRSVIQAPRIFPIGERALSARLVYLSDSGEELREQPDRIRVRARLHTQYHANALTKAIWEKTNSLPFEYRSATWENLLLDAELLLPHVGPALVLIAASIETAVSAVLNHLATKSAVPDQLWQWIIDRGDYRKEPTVEEECDVLLSVLGGKSLKTDPKLWQSFMNIKSARNNFVHEGVPSITKKGKALSSAEISQLLDSAKQIIKFLEEFLPEILRRPITMEKTEFQLRREVGEGALNPHIISGQAVLVPHLKTG